jgi:hypothetical protein
MECHFFYTNGLVSGGLQDPRDHTNLHQTPSGGKMTFHQGIVHGVTVYAIRTAVPRVVREQYAVECRGIQGV